MPAKGEISEQESNCDIENSWSQPMYGEINAKFFRTTFPGIFPQEHNAAWNTDEFFTVQDLSAGNNPVSNTNKNMKSFDFRLPQEATTSGNAANTSHTICSAGNNNLNNSNNNSNLLNYGTTTHAAELLPSTSLANANNAGVANKKKRKQSTSKTNGSINGVTSNISSKQRNHPTSTITSQQLLLEQQLQLPFNNQTQFANLQLQQPNALSASTTTASSSASNVMHNQMSGLSSAVVLPVKPIPRRKLYQCKHCSSEFTKLKDRNNHLILQHNYVRHNRRLISVTSQSSLSNCTASTSSGAAIANAELSTIAASTLTVLATTSSNSAFAEVVEDSKQGIMKIEIEQAMVQQQQSTGLSLSVGVETKTELKDENEKEFLSISGSINGDSHNDGLLLSASQACQPTNVVSSAAVDSKVAVVPPLALTTPASKLATLYRMLVSFNISTLKQSQNVSEFEEKLMESSIFYCYTCRSNFNSVKLYDAHLTEHPAECFTCGRKFQRWKNFSLHLKRHLGWKEFGCSVCDKRFVVRSALVEHMRMHTGQMPLKCKICGKHFKRYSNLTQHRKRHGRKIVRKKEYVCHCGEVLPSKARFFWHKETHDPKPKCCPHCCDRFVHANSLRRHIRLAHSDKFDYTEPMECPMCKQIFAKSSIKAHMATHSMDTQHDCPICNKSFSTKWNLKIHSWVHANRTAKPFKCEHCPKAFVREVDFKNHMNSHKQIKPYTCEFCGCKFIRKYNYMRHRREHHGNKKFTCDLCKKSFHRHYYLIEHRRIHTGERPFQCTICGKSSTTKTNHNKHLKIHHSRDPFTVEA